MLIMELNSGREAKHSPNTSPEYALAYEAAFDEEILSEFWDIDKEQLYMALPFSLSTRTGKTILYLGDTLGLGDNPIYGTVLSSVNQSQRVV